MRSDPSLLHAPEVLKLLANDGRLSLLALLVRSDYTVQELTALVGLSQNLVSYHLHRLRTYGLLSERRSAADHRDVYYHLELERLQTAYFAAAEQVHPAFRVVERTLPQIRLLEKGETL